MDNKSFLKHVCVNEEEIYGETNTNHNQKSECNKNNNKKIKVRANTSIASVSHILPSYWVWDKLIVNLQKIGYDDNSLAVFPYDFRLSFYELEKRDFFFYKLKKTIEMMRKINNKKIIIVSHSLGGLFAQRLKMYDNDFKENSLSIFMKRF